MNAQPSLLKKELKIKSDKNNDYNVEIFIDSNSFLNIIIIHTKLKIIIL